MRFLDNLSKKEKLGLIVAGLFLLVTFVDRFIVHPIKNKIFKVEKAIEINEKQLGLSLRNLAQKDAIMKEYKKYIPTVKKIGSDEEEVAKILGEIESLARKASVSLLDMKPQKKNEQDFYKEYSVEIEVEGEVAQLISFLYELNVSPQVIRAEKLRFASQKQSTTTVKLSALLTKILIL